MSKRLDHNAPLRHLVKQVLHKDRDLRANVVRLRWRRKKAPKPELPPITDENTATP